jgi:hypothetical protein
LSRVGSQPVSFSQPILPTPWLRDRGWASTQGSTCHGAAKTRAGAGWQTGASPQPAHTPRHTQAPTLTCGLGSQT